MEQEINEGLEELFEQIERSLPRRNAQVRKAVDRARLSIADILAKYTDSNGTIPRSKVNAVLRDLAAVEGEIYRNLRNEMAVVVEDVGEETVTELSELILAAIGVAALIKVAGLPKDFANLSVGAAESVFGALTGKTIREFVEAMVSSTFNRRGSDQKRLNDRLRRIARVLRKEIEVTLRESIRNGEGTTEILRKVERKFSDLDWQIDTLVETESLYTMRQSVARFAEESGIVAALKIVDFPHGDIREHMRHKCYIYANSDEHGLGKGVYPIGTRKIRNPHPRCRSMLLFVLKDEFK